MAEGEDVEVGAAAAVGSDAGDAGSGLTDVSAEGKIRSIAITENVPPDKWRLRRNWFRLAWMAFVVGFIFVGVWAAYELHWGAVAVAAVAALEAPFFLIAFFAYLGIIRKKKRTRVVRVKKISA